MMESASRRLLWQVSKMSLVVLLALLAVCVRADYQVEARFYRYQNPGHLFMSPFPTQPDRCCDELALGPLTCTGSEICDNSFLICLHEPGVSCSNVPAEDPLRLESVTITQNDDDLTFEEGPNTLQGLPNPVVFNVTGPWPSDPQRMLTMDVFDVDFNNTTNYIGGFTINITTLSLGNSTGPVQYISNPRLASGDLYLDLSITVRCADTYYGLDCSRVCVDTDSDLGHYTCDSEGSIVCSEGYRNTSTNCTECIPAEGCSAVGGYCQGPNDCSCLPGYAGGFCEIDLDPCGHTMPCLNGATCMNIGDGEFNCTCTEGFDGERCQSDECDPDPCQNGATCVAQLSDYTCQCVDGHGGKNCDIDVDDCLLNPCLNGGTCVDQLSDYTCQCVDGYGGKNCDIIDVDDCQPNPCLNGGTCIDLLFNYTCDCQTGYTGRACGEASEDTGSQSGSSGLSAAVLAGVVAGIAVLALIIVVLVIVIVAVLRRRKSSAKVNLQRDQDVDTKGNEAYGTVSAVTIPLVANQAYRTVQHSAPPEDEDEGYVINQLTYDLPHTTTAPTITTAPNAAYGGVQCPTDVSGDAYDYIAPSQLL